MIVFGLEAHISRTSASLGSDFSVFAILVFRRASLADMRRLTAANLRVFLAFVMVFGGECGKVKVWTEEFRRDLSRNRVSRGSGRVVSGGGGWEVVVRVFC